MLLGLTCNGLILKGRTESRHKVYAFSSNLGKKNIFFCQNTLMLFVNIRQRKWSQLHAKAEISIVKEKQEKDKQTRDRKLNEIAEDVIDFLKVIGKQEGEFHATRFAREGACLMIRDGNSDVIELPSCYSKRQVYARCCYERGWDPRATAKGTHGKTQDYPKRVFDDILWPAGSTPRPTCAWSSFNSI